MSLNAAALEILVAKGLSGDDLIAVARALESSAHRSPAARRQASYRERKSVTSDVTRDVTVSPNDRDILTPSIPIANAIADPEKVLFDSGVELLKAGGTADGKARSLLGKWKRDHGVATVIEALSTAKREGAIEPISFIEATLRTKAKQQAPPAWDGMA